MTERKNNYSTRKKERMVALLSHPEFRTYISLCVWWRYSEPIASSYRHPFGVKVPNFFVLLLLSCLRSLVPRSSGEWWVVTRLMSLSLSHSVLPYSIASAWQWLIFPLPSPSLWIHHYISPKKRKRKRNFKPSPNHNQTVQAHPAGAITGSQLAPGDATLSSPLG